MRIQIVSDLHLSVRPFELPATDAAVVVVAGDVARPREAVDWMASIPKPVLFVAGNHEFYGGTIDGTRAELRRLAAGTRIRVLDDDEAVIDGVRFLGSTLWTNFDLFDSEASRSEAMREASRFIRDFTRIRTGDSADALFTPEDSVERFRVHARWLRERMAQPHAGPTVVITHHAPSKKSIHPRFAGSPLNACFVSDAEHLLDQSRVTLWIHGHTHDSFDYAVHGTRVVCNARGYAKDGNPENRLFDPRLIVEV